MSEPDNAGVKLLPPVALAIIAAVCIVAENVFTLPRLPTDQAAFHIFGFLMVVASGALGFWGVWQFIAAKVNPVPVKPVTSLLTGGIYRITRNPMYLGMAAMLVGVAVLFDSYAFLAGAVAMFLYFNFYAIPREETYLTRTFGQAFTAYCARVRRWI
jgi:protein-S-isoprenylcysteine O-methyltransferase Ste14